MELENLAWTLILGAFFIQICVGLGPAMLIRYVFVRHPLSSKAAGWICAIYLFLLAMLKFYQSEGTNTNMLPYLIAWYIAVKILSRGHKPEKPEPPQQDDPLKGSSD